MMDGRRIGRNVPQSDPVCVRDFLQSWNLEALEAVRLKHGTGSVNHRDKLGRIAKRMGVDQEIVGELAEVCNPENLMCGEEPKTKKELLQMNKELQPENVHLECVRHQMEQRELRDSNENFKVSAHKHMKYSHLDEFTFVRPLEESLVDTVPAESRVPVPNVVLSVQITKCLLSKTASTKIRPSESFMVLGTQTLADLKNAIKCPMDEVIAGDFSCMPDVDPETLPKAKQVYKSGFFFIENVFYNDTRCSDNKDYSKPILEWAYSIWPGADLSVASMEKTQLLDLKIKLGCYYLFTHQGNCEHSLLFQDIRLFTSEDAQNASLYPIRTAERTKARKLCQGCGKISAKWVVFDSPLIPTDPCFFCPICFKAFLFTKDGKKTSNFKAHHYAEHCL